MTLDKTSAAIIVKPIEGKKGSLKAALTINGKKYSLSIKVVNK